MVGVRSGREPEAPVSMGGGAEAKRGEEVEFMMGPGRRSEVVLCGTLDSKCLRAFLSPRRFL